ncbi:MAG: hypothetical protein VX432_01860 [Candidatus Poribacteria bacterium]|nr:hypothetical protein [Candidatus Poribacteria bacterium]
MKHFILFFLLAALFQPVQARAQELVLYFPFEGSGDTVDDKSGKTIMGNLIMEKLKE